MTMTTERRGKTVGRNFFVSYTKYVFIFLLFHNIVDQGNLVPHATILCFQHSL